MFDAKLLHACTENMKCGIYIQENRQCIYVVINFIIAPAARTCIMQ